MHRVPQLLLSGLILACMSFPAPAQAQSEDWQGLNQAMTDAQVIPSYAAFAEAGTRLADNGEQFCATVSEDSLAELRSAFHETMDAWQAIQHVRFGPVTYFNWNFRLQYWPDDRGIASRQINALLAEADTSGLTPDDFASQSVAVQGFPALELLLFDEDSLAQLQGNTFRCQLIVAISRNIGEIASGIHQRWRDEFRATVALDDDSGYFTDAQDVSIDFVKAIVETIPLLSEQKLALPLGEDYAAYRNRRAESWRSQRSLRNLGINLDTLETWFFGTDAQSMALADVFPQTDVDQIRTIFSDIDDILADLPDSFDQQVSDEAGYQQLAELKSQLDALYEALEVAVKNTDLYLGFNSLDGD